ncbi:MAG: MFS transporter [Anaerolineae bacterium]|nr:MFS transporter [Anaerolineae bacterium]
MAMATGRADRFAAFRNRPLMTLMLGHFTVDMYTGLIPMLYPLWLAQFGLDLKTVGLVSLAFSGTASLSQPLFGWLADRRGTRYIGIALIWTATFFAAVGFAPTFGLVVLLAGIAGLGSGAYHPFGALNANAVIEKAQRNTAMSVYVTGGTIGVALAPLLGALIFPIFGVHGTALMIIPGVLIALWLLSEMRSMAGHYHKDAIKLTTARRPIPMLPLLAIIIIMMSRSWTMQSIATFTPTWYASMGYANTFYGALTTVLQLSSAVGTIWVGTLADRFGRRVLIIGSLILTIPAILLFAQFTGPVAFVTAALVGISAASTNPLMLLIAQQLMAGRAGIASGLILGLGFVTGAIGIPITGAMIDAFGFQRAFQLQVILVAATVVLAWFLPDDARLHRLSEQPSAGD